MRKKEKLLLKYSANEPTQEVFSYFEIAFISVIFIIVLYLLYPKGMLKRQVLQEQSNYELTAIYLKNMLRIEPDNTKLILASAKILLKEQKMDLAYKLINVLKNSKDLEIKKEVLYLEFEYWKIKRQKAKNKKEQIKINKKLREIIREIAKFKKINSPKKWYQEAISLEERSSALKFLEPRIKKGEKDALESCVYIASEIKNNQKEIECLERLSKVEKEFPKKWVLALYSLYLEEKNYKKAYKVARELAKIDPTLKSEPARVNILAKNYKSAVDDYLRLYNEELDPVKKVNYLFRAINTLQNGGKKEEAIKLAKKYQEKYLDNDEVIKKFIRFYLSINNLKEANALAKRILHIELAK
jgi:tetratricopeptide (TPR) repeat protein